MKRNGEHRNGNSSPLSRDGSGRAWPRRKILQVLSALGVGSAVFGRALVSLAEDQPKITEEMIRQAEWISGLQYTEAKRKLMLEGMNQALAGYETLRKIPVDNAVAPALLFFPQPNMRANARIPRPALKLNASGATKPSTAEDVAFSPVTELAKLIRSKQISSTELTKLYLERLRRYDPVLQCVITLTEDLALAQAKKADEEIAAGKYRGVLHGIPWGAKDLLAVPGYPTTWGAEPYKDQVRKEKATVAAKLEEAGAVLVAKLTMGALAWGDVWFGGTTKNPWNVKEGSSGSSAGSASASAAGLVGFAIGTETLGSIVSPSTRCGNTGLRPTFGRVSRYGAMGLCFSMDKIGPITRSVDDCALVFYHIHGADPLDPFAVEQPFAVPGPDDFRKLRVGCVEDLFEEDRAKNAEKDEDKERLRESQAFDKRTLEVLRGLGVKLKPIKLPTSVPVEPLGVILGTEASAAFDELTRSGRDDMLKRQVVDAWPNVFRQGQLTPAVEYIRACRFRTLLMAEMEKLFADIDVYVCPSFGGKNLLITNLTGHPAVVLPNGFHAKSGTPASITFLGGLYGDDKALALARAVQNATDFHKKRPPLDAQIAAKP
jgi:Asp-tRNA(Asn)/Glu-tRNA(Gln) amidotransferase A subunit family amidase